LSTRVLLADDHVLVRQSLKTFLESENFWVVAEASNGVEAIALAQQFRPALAILDLGMPLMNGTDAAKEILRISPETKIIALTMHAQPEYVLTALKYGVHGYVLKSQAATELLLAAREVERGVTYLSPSITQLVARGMLGDQQASAEVLSSRERHVLQLIAEGKTTKEIALQLGVSIRTGESHRANIMDKLNIHETAGLVRHAIRIGLVNL
jgi:DNA-binding NarL/FixJ family response regulator